MFTTTRRRYLLTTLLLLLLGGLIAFSDRDNHTVHAQATFDCTTVSEIPTNECEALVALYVASNGDSWLDNVGWLGDTTPCDWAGVGCRLGRIHTLYLDQNGLVGSLPTALGDLTALTWLQLNNNQLDGSIPASLGNLTQVTWLRLENNQFSGSIPAELGNMTALESLYLAGNPLTGAVPAQLGNLANLKKLYLGDTLLTGAVPSQLGNLSQLQALTLGNTGLTGALPHSFTNLGNLTYFHFLSTTICEPTDSAFQTWITNVANVYSPDLACQDNPTPEPTASVTVTPAPTASATLTPTPFPTTPPTTGAGLCEGLIVDQANHPMTPLAKPDYLQAVVDPAFGTTIRRISDVAANVTGEQAVIKPMYNTIQAWNADESYLILYQRGVGHHLYNGITYEPLRELNIRPADLEEVFWHFSDPDILFYVEAYYINAAEPGQRLIRYHVSSDTREVVRSFNDVCEQNEGVVSGNDVQMMSWDSDVIGLRCGGAPSAKFFSYRISTDTVSPIIQSGEGNPYQPWYAPQPAPSGNRMVIDPYLLDMNLNLIERLNIASPEHGTLGKFADGRDGLFAVAFAEGPEGGCGPGALIAHDLTDGSCQTLVGQENGYPYPGSDTHLSALSHRNPGWVAVSTIGVANNGGTAQAGQELLDNEIYLANTADGAVCRVAHHRSFGNGGSFGYWSEPHVVISPSGTRLLFGSDWEGGASVDTYVIELPSFSVVPTAITHHSFLPIVPNSTRTTVTFVTGFSLLTTFAGWIYLRH